MQLLNSPTLSMSAVKLLLPLTVSSKMKTSTPALSCTSAGTVRSQLTARMQAFQSSVWNISLSVAVIWSMLKSISMSQAILPVLPITTSITSVIRLLLQWAILILKAVTTRSLLQTAAMLPSVISIRSIISALVLLQTLQLMQLQVLKFITVHLLQIMNQLLLLTV